MRGPLGRGLNMFPVKSSLLLGLLGTALTIDPTGGHEVPSWCAEPRAAEPVLVDALRLGSGQDSVAAAQRAEYEVPHVAVDEIVLVRDEKTCKQAANAYLNHLRRFVPSQEWPDAPVLVVRIGDVYLVDDLRSRTGDDAYWETMVFDKTWRHLTSYGGGS